MPPSPEGGGAGGERCPAATRRGGGPGMSEPSLPTLGDLPAAEVLRVDEACHRFEQAWLGWWGRPRPARAVLVAELLRLDLHYWPRAGERPAAEDYRRRLPGQDHVVDAVFAAAAPP